MTSKICLSQKDKNGNYPCEIIYKSDRMAKFIGDIQLEGEYLQSEQYPNLNLNPYSGVYDDFLGGIYIQFQTVDGQEQIEFQQINAVLPSNQKIELKLENKALNGKIIDKKGILVHDGHVD